MSSVVRHPEHGRAVVLVGKRMAKRPESRTRYGLSQCGRAEPALFGLKLLKQSLFGRSHASAQCCLLVERASGIRSRCKRNTSQYFSKPRGAQRDELLVRGSR